MADDDDPEKKKRKGKVLWTKKDAFVMPLLPESLKVDPVVAALLHLLTFLEVSGDDTVDPDWAVEAMEHVGHYLQQLPAERVAELRQQAQHVAKLARKQRWGREAVAFLTEFPGNFYVGEDD